MNENQLQELMNSHGFTRQQAIDHNRSAVSQGMDLDGDGFATGDEYLSWQAQGGGANPAHQQAQERAQNYSQLQADAAAMQQQYDQSINEWEDAFSQRDEQYNSDLEKLDTDYQKQFDNFAAATIENKEEKPQNKAYIDLKDSMINPNNFDNQFNNFDGTNVERRKYTFQ